MCVSAASLQRLLETFQTGRKVKTAHHDDVEAGPADAVCLQYGADALHRGALVERHELEAVQLVHIDSCRAR